MTPQAKRSVVLTWAVFSFIPLLFCLLALTSSFNEGLKSYGSCVEKGPSFLPVEIVGTCCIIQNQFKNRITINKDKLLIPSSDTARIFWSHMHSLSAVIFCLFLTPNLLYFSSLWLRNARTTLIRLAGLTSISVYVFVATTIIYALTTFKDS